MSYPIIKPIPIEKVKISFHHITGIHPDDGYQLDWDQYYLEFYAGMSTREISLTLDFKNKRTFGDILCFGAIDNLEEGNVIEVYEYLQKFNKLKRDAMW